MSRFVLISNPPGDDGSWIEGAWAWHERIGEVDLSGWADARLAALDPGMVPASTDQEGTTLNDEKQTDTPDDSKTSDDPGNATNSGAGDATATAHATTEAPRPDSGDEPDKGDEGEGRQNPGAGIGGE